MQLEGRRWRVRKQFVSENRLNEIESSTFLIAKPSLTAVLLPHTRLKYGRISPEYSAHALHCCVEVVCTSSLPNRPEQNLRT